MDVPRTIKLTGNMNCNNNHLGDKRRWKHDIKVGLTETRCVDGAGFDWLRIRFTGGFCPNDNKHLGSIKYRSLGKTKKA
jgi:hypothetical protein